MKLLCVASLLATAGAFTTSPAAFTTQSYSVGVNNIAESGEAHRTRRATIVMDGKANGKLSLPPSCSRSFWGEKNALDCRKLKI